MEAERPVGVWGIPRYNRNDLNGALLYAPSVEGEEGLILFLCPGVCVNVCFSTNDVLPFQGKYSVDMGLYVDIRNRGG